MVALDLKTGKPIWKTPNPRNWTMTHASITPMEIGGQRTYVYPGSGGVVGVSAKDGKVLWDTTEWVVSTATVPTPVDCGNGRIFLCGGYNAGAMMLQIEGGTTKTVFRLKSQDFGSDQQTPVFYKGNIYGARPNGEMVCLGLDGKTVWTSGRNLKFGLGPYMIAGGLLYAMNDNGLLTLAQAKPDGFVPLAQAQVLSGRESWGPLALAGGRLIARDSTRMVCLDVSKR
jgi:outer membrane protein assembly factor BamB